MLVMFNSNNEFVTIIANKDPSESQISAIARSFGYNPSEVIVEKYDYNPSETGNHIMFDKNRVLQKVTVATEEVKIGEDKNQVAIMGFRKVVTVSDTQNKVETKYSGSGRG